MTVPAWQSRAPSHAYGTFNDDETYGFGELSPGERVCPPPSRGGKAARRGALLLLIALGGAWAVAGDQLTWPEWLPFDKSALLALMDRGQTGLAASPASTAAPVAPPAMTELTPKPAPLQGAPAPTPDKAAASKEAAAPLTTAALPSAGAASRDAPSAELPPPVADPADAYQVRALAVGLHPGLSRALLSRLSAADYRNAGIAIQAAIAETPDDGVYIWPRQRKPDLALFHVHFVPGAAPDCRRYVVTVAKDGWVTTALPMERCGPKPGQGPESKRAATDKSR